jgi:hypothetical protein
VSSLDVWLVAATARTEDDGQKTMPSWIVAGQLIPGHGVAHWIIVALGVGALLRVCYLLVRYGPTDGSRRVLAEIRSTFATKTAGRKQ